MWRNVAVGLIGILVISTGVVVYITQKPAPAETSSVTSASTTIPSGDRVESAQYRDIATNYSPSIKKPRSAVVLSGNNYTENGNYYDIIVNYTSTTTLRNKIGVAADKAAVTLMKDFISDTINQFKDDGNFDNLTPRDIIGRGFDKGRKERLRITYLVAAPAQTVSYIFTIYKDTLGAHGNTSYRTFTFDAKTGSLLFLADIFSPNTPYLEKLSTISRAELPVAIGNRTTIQAIEAGTMPEGKNFENFYLDGASLVLLFPPYQVAPYSAGPQALNIPLSELSSVLKPEYR